MARGDIGVTPSSGFVAWCVRKITRAPVSHAFLAVDGHGERIVQADPQGACFTVASQYRHVEWLTGLSEGLTGEQRDTVVAWATAHLGVPYSWLDDVAIGMQDVFGWAPGWLRRRLSSHDTLMCSQFAVAAYRAAGVDLFPGMADGSVSPGDLWRLNRERVGLEAAR